MTIEQFDELKARILARGPGGTMNDATTIRDPHDVHTPGPWKYDGKFMVTIPTVCGDLPFRVTPADARLIVMAPDLLKALRGSWHMCQSILAVRDGVPDEALAAFADGLQVIIAKAEGTA